MMGEGLLNDRNGSDAMMTGRNVPLRGIADSTKRESAPPAHGQDSVVRGYPLRIAGYVAGAGGNSATIPSAPPDAPSRAISARSERPLQSDWHPS